MGVRFSLMREWTPQERRLVKAQLSREFEVGGGGGALEGFDEHVSMAAWTAGHVYAGLILCSGKDRMLSIDYLTTAAKMRGKGLGKKLVKKAEARARLMGYRAVELQVDATSSEFGWYRSLGYVPSAPVHHVMAVPMQPMSKALLISS